MNEAIFLLPLYAFILRAETTSRLNRQLSMWKVQNLLLQNDAELNTTRNNVAGYFKLLSDEKPTEIYVGQYRD